MAECPSPGAGAAAAAPEAQEAETATPAAAAEQQLALAAVEEDVTPRVAPAECAPVWTEGLLVRQPSDTSDEQLLAWAADSDFWDHLPFMARSASTPALGREALKPLRLLGVHSQGQSFKRSPLKARPVLQGVKVDRWGFPVLQTRAPVHAQEWNSSHHLTGGQNELKPTKLRRYFSAPETEDTLKRTLSESGRRSTRSLLRALDGPAAQPPKRPFVSADVGAPLVPERHVVGGTMRDRDGKARTWNERWHKGMGALNDRCHPDHRAYFTQTSLFEESPSQNWRRFLDQEVDRGVWAPVATRRPPRFPPLGGRLTGRSGAPVPSPQ